MTNPITIAARASGKRVEINYAVRRPWREAFNVNNINGWWAKVDEGEFRIRLEDTRDVNAVPPDLAAISFLCN